MRLNRRSFSRYRPRLLTIVLLIVIAALLLLSNLSDEIRPRHQDVSQSLANLCFDAREPGNRRAQAGYGNFLNVSCGWPLIWRQYVIEIGWSGNKVHGGFCSTSRLAGNLIMWLAILAAPVHSCEWLLRRYPPRPRWSLRAMLAAVALTAALCSWCVALRKRADLQDSIIAAITQRHGLGNVWVNRWGPQWLEVVGAGRFRRDVIAVNIDGGELERKGIFDRLGELPQLKYLAAELSPGLVDALPGMQRIRFLTVNGWNRFGEDRAVWHDCLAAIGQMRTLEQVYLDADNTAIADESLRSFASLPNIKSISLCFVGTDSPPLLKNLPTLPHLHSLVLNGSKIGDDDVRYIAALPSLRSLSLVDTEVTAGGFAELAACNSLEELCIGANAVSPAAIKSLLAVKRLKRLHIDGAPYGRDVAALIELVIDDSTVLAAETDLVRCHDALAALRRSKPGIVIDDQCNASERPEVPMVLPDRENVHYTYDLYVHQLLRDWKEQDAK